MSTISTMAPGASSGPVVNTSLSSAVMTTVLAVASERGAAVDREAEEVGVYSIWSMGDQHTGAYKC